MMTSNLGREILRALHKIIDNQIEIKKGQERILSALRSQRRVADDDLDVSDDAPLHRRMSMPLPKLTKERVYRVVFALVVIFVLMEIGELFGVNLTALLPVLLL